MKTRKIKIKKITKKTLPKRKSTRNTEKQPKQIKPKPNMQRIKNKQNRKRDFALYEMHLQIEKESHESNLNESPSRKGH